MGRICEGEGAAGTCVPQYAGPQGRRVSTESVNTYREHIPCVHTVHAYYMHTVHAYYVHTCTTRGLQSVALGFRVQPQKHAVLWGAYMHAYYMHAYRDYYTCMHTVYYPCLYSALVVLLSARPCILQL
jgi:hypothetical protein